MRVRELIDILRDQPPEAEVELAIVAPVDLDGVDDDITVDRYTVEGVLPWQDEDADPDDDADGLVIWLVGGEVEDVNSFLDALDELQGDGHDHDH